jgi:hypothetical protein
MLQHLQSALPPPLYRSILPSHPADQQYSYKDAIRIKHTQDPVNRQQSSYSSSLTSAYLSLCVRHRDNRISS